MAIKRYYCSCGAIVDGVIGKALHGYDHDTRGERTGESGFRWLRADAFYKRFPHKKEVGV